MAKKDTSEYSHTYSLPEVVSDSILPAFKDLSKSQLLSSFLHGVIDLVACHKRDYSSLTTVQLATSLTFSVLNDGATTLNWVLENLGIDTGNHSRKAS